MSQRERIALFLPSLAGGGAERAMLHLAGELADRTYDVDLVLAHAEGPYLTQVPSTVRVVDLKARQTLTSIPRLCRYLRQARPAAMVSALEHANVAAIWAKRLSGMPTRLVISVQNTLTSDTQHAVSFKKRLEPRFVKRFYPAANAIVAVSAGVADDLSRMIGLSRERITVIYNPVVSQEIVRKAQQPVEHPWFATGQPPVILAVGRLGVQKDYPTLLKAFQLVTSRCTARLMILGEGEDRSSLETLAQQLGIADRVAMPGFVANPYSFMSRSRIFVMSSRWEGLPTVLIEALACGTPVISTDCPSGPREILAEGRYGVLVPVGNAESLAGALEKTLDSGRATPPEESWKPYLISTATSEYLHTLFPTAKSAVGSPAT